MPASRPPRKSCPNKNCIVYGLFAQSREATSFKAFFWQSGSRIRTQSYHMLASYFRLQCRSLSTGISDQPQRFQRRRKQTGESKTLQVPPPRLRPNPPHQLTPTSRSYSSNSCVDGTQEVHDKDGLGSCYIFSDEAAKRTVGNGGPW